MNIVITGASSGIGFESALYFASLSHQVFAVARREEKLVKLKEESVRRNYTGKIHPLAGDISDEHFLDNLVEEIKKESGSIQILINNAGALLNKPFENLTLNDWKEIYNTNVFAVVSIIRKLLPLFDSTTLNHIVNISNMGGQICMRQSVNAMKGMNTVSLERIATLSKGVYTLTITNIAGSSRPYGLIKK